MKDKLSLACVQTTSTPDLAHNLSEIERLVRQAAAGGAEFVALPEAVEFIGDGGQAFVDFAARGDDTPRSFLAGLAKDLGIWLLVGSLSVRTEAGRLANRSHLIDDRGSVAATYDKIHLFDVTLPNGESHRESNIYTAGASIVAADTPWGLVGLSICYDLRFPALYRRLAQAGARMLFVPAAFTPMTGALHWHALLRARAIETGCFVAAPAQCGHHVGERASFGHSLIVDPWGRVLADGGETAGTVAATLDLAEVERYRTAIPSIGLERLPDGSPIAARS